MNQTLVLAAVTAVLKYLLENGLVDHSITTALGGDTTISALPPDKIANGAGGKNQLNVYLYDVRSKGLYSGSRHAPGRPENAGNSMPRSLELRYLLTAYGEDDLQTEILLGYGLELFHGVPVLDGPAIKKILKALSTQSGGHLIPPPRAVLSDPRLSECFTSIKVRAQAIETEDMVNLWSAFQVSYRLSLTYQVSVELVEEPPVAERKS